MNSEEQINFLKQNNVDVDKGLENMMDIETYDEILNDFYENVPEDMKKIENYKNAGDMPNYAILVHALKSNARSFGFTDLGEMAYAHELESKAGNTNYVNENYQSLVDKVNETLDIIKKYKEL